MDPESDLTARLEIRRPGYSMPRAGRIETGICRNFRKCADAPTAVAPAPNHWMEMRPATGQCDFPTPFRAGILTEKARESLVRENSGPAASGNPSGILPQGVCPNPVICGHWRVSAPVQGSLPDPRISESASRYKASSDEETSARRSIQPDARSSQSPASAAFPRLQSIKAAMIQSSAPPPFPKSMDF